MSLAKSQDQLESIGTTAAKNHALTMAGKAGSRPSLTTEFIGDQIVTTISASQNQLNRDNVTRISVKRTKTPDNSTKKSTEEKGKKGSKKDKKEREKERR